MTNKEKYKQAFSALHASDNLSLEGNTMKKTNRKFRMRPALAAGLCAAALIGCMSAAYAADVGGIRETIQIWIHGSSTNAQVIDNGDGSYQYILDGEESPRVVSGGGVAVDDDGNAIPLSPEEVAEGCFASEVVREPDGSVWLYDYGNSFDISDYLKDGACKVVLEENGKKIYFDIEENGGGGYAFSRSDSPTGSSEDYVALN